MKLPGNKSAQWKAGYRAAVIGKSRCECPYNGPELRAEWFAGYDTRANSGIKTKRVPVWALRNQCDACGGSYPACGCSNHNN